MNLHFNRLLNRILCDNEEALQTLCHILDHFDWFRDLVEITGDAARATAGGAEVAAFARSKYFPAVRAYEELIRSGHPLDSDRYHQVLGTYATARKGLYRRQRESFKDLFRELEGLTHHVAGIRIGIPRVPEHTLDAIFSKIQAFETRTMSRRGRVKIAAR